MTEKFLDVENVLGSSVFHCGFPVTKGIAVNLEDPRISKFTWHRTSEVQSAFSTNHHGIKKENLFKKLDIQIKYGEVPQVGIGVQLSDWNHAEATKAYVDTGKVSETQRLCGRARGTVYRHISRHNLSIKQKGFCDRCKLLAGAEKKEGCTGDITKMKQRFLVHAAELVWRINWIQYN